MAIIGIDVDGVIADLLTTWLSWYNHDYNDHLTYEEITAWDVSQFVKPSCGKKIFSYPGKEAFYLDVSPIEGSREGCRILRQYGNRIVFITSCFLGSADQKWDWLCLHGFLPRKYTTPNDLVITGDKSLVSVDILIDDYKGNLENFPRKKIIFDQPYNKEDNFPRMIGWKDLELISQMISSC